MKLSAFQCQYQYSTFHFSMIVLYNLFVLHGIRMLVKLFIVHGIRNYVPLFFIHRMRMLVKVVLNVRSRVFLWPRPSNIQAWPVIHCTATLTRLGPSLYTGSGSSIRPLCGIRILTKTIPLLCAGPESAQRAPGARQGDRQVQGILLRRVRGQRILAGMCVTFSIIR